MSSFIKDLEPKKVFEIFDEILKIPRPSGNEKNIASFIVDYAKNIGCSAYTDENGNVIIDAPATKGKENCSLVILQGHMDMVCVQTDSGTHDFSKDPIDAYIDGDFIRAKVLKLQSFSTFFMLGGCFFVHLQCLSLLS